MRCIVAFIDGLAAETMVATCSVSSGAGRHRSLRCVVADVKITSTHLAMDWDLPAAIRRGRRRRVPDWGFIGT